MNKEKLRSILNERLPRLLELSFGCEVRNGGAGKLTVLNSESIITAYGVIRSYNRDDVEFIGHPPQWSDVLEVLGEDYAMSGDGAIYKIYPETGDSCGYAKNGTYFNGINLSKPPLEQDEEVLEKLIEILTVKK